MRKILVTAMTFLIAMSLFTACNGDNSSSSNTNSTTKIETTTAAKSAEPQITTENSTTKTPEKTEEKVVEKTDKPAPKPNSNADESAIADFKSISTFKSNKGNDYVEYQKKNPNFSAEEIVTYVNLGLNRNFYTGIEQIKNPDSLLVLSNKYRQLPKNYEPSDLELIPDKYSKATRKLYLRKEALTAFQKMCDAARADGFNIFASSAYRGYSYQYDLYNNYVASDGKENADRYSSRAGHSEHQTGLVLDVRNLDKVYDDFGSTPEYQWVLKNAHKYGYVVHYTEEGEWITGFMKEEWHLRYIGVEHATKVHDSNAILDAYLIQFNLD